MRRLVAAAIALLALVTACSGSSDAPRPLAPSSFDDPGGSGLSEIMRDDDGDGVENDHDRCPLAFEPGADLRRDGCPDVPAPDAGAVP